MWTDQDKLSEIKIPKSFLLRHCLMVLLLADDDRETFMYVHLEVFKESF